MTFEEGMAQLEDIVRAMESGRMPLEEMLIAYERANALHKRLSEQLIEGRTRILCIAQVKQDIVETPEEAP